MRVIINISIRLILVGKQYDKQQNVISNVRTQHGSRDTIACVAYTTLKDNTACSKELSIPGLPPCQCHERQKKIPDWNFNWTTLQM